MKKLYQTPEILPILICMQDILTASNDLEDDFKSLKPEKL